MKVRSTSHGIVTVAGLELRLRVRAGRWRWLLGIWFLLLTGFVTLLRLAVVRSANVVTQLDEVTTQTVKRPIGTPMFGGLMLFMLGVGLLVVPSLSAQSVNGDRERGVLASLQTTLLSPVQIAGGKLLAAWGTSLVFLAASVPLVIWCVAEGGVGLLRAAACLLTVALVFGVVVSVAQCLSSVFVRSTTSAVMSYLFVFALSILTLVSFALALGATGKKVTRTESLPVFDENGTVSGTQQQTYTATETDSTKVWWILSPNPFVVLADAAPAVAPRCDPRTGQRLYEPLDPLGGMARSVRELRVPKANGVTRVVTGPHCPEEFAGITGYAPPGEPTPQLREAHPGPVWPYGLGFDALLAVGAFTVTTRRLRAPAKKLAKGVRVA